MSAAPEYAYFNPPEVDRLVSLVWQLAQEVYVTRSRLIALENTLAQHGVIPADMLSPSQLGESTKRTIEADNAAMMDRLVRVLIETDDHRMPMRRQFLDALNRLPHGSTPG